MANDVNNNKSGLHPDHEKILNMALDDKYKCLYKFERDTKNFELILSVACLVASLFGSIVVFVSMKESYLKLTYWVLMIETIGFWYMTFKFLKIYFKKF
jgi:hypothetical protein